MDDTATRPVRLAVQGAGPIGKRRIEHVANEDCADLVAIVDPSPDTEALADRMDVAWYPTFAAMAREDKPERVIVATSNQMHVGNGFEAVGAGVAVLAEKPIACERLPVAAQDPLGLQVRNFCGVIRGTAQPVVSGQEGLSTLKVMAAAKEAAATGRAIDVD